ncbi:MAG: TRAP transporter small permease [Burkholderiales bacterium]
MMDKIQVWLRAGLHSVVSLALLAMMAVTVADVVGRYLLAAPIPGSFEISQFLLAVTVFASLPLVAGSRAQITVGLLESVFSGRALRVQRALVLLFSASAVALMAWQLARLAGRLEASERVTGSLSWPIAPLVYVIAGFSLLALIATVIAGWQDLRAASGEPVPKAGD